MSKKIIALAAILAVLVVAYVVYKQTKPAPKADQTTSVKADQIVKKEVEANKVPEKFPVDVPIESGAKITQNYNATAPDGRFQATRVFETEKSLVYNFALYRNYLTSVGYKEQSTIDTPNYKMVSSTKGNVNLQVSIDENSQFHAKTVNISYTEVPTQQTP